MIFMLIPAGRIPVRSSNSVVINRHRYVLLTATWIFLQLHQTTAIERYGQHGKASKGGDNGSGALPVTRDDQHDCYDHQCCGNFEYCQSIPSIILQPGSGKRVRLIGGAIATLNQE